MPRNSVWHDIAIIYAPAKVKAAMLGPSWDIAHNDGGGPAGPVVTLNTGGAPKRQGPEACPLLAAKKGFVRSAVVFPELR